MKHYLYEVASFFSGEFLKRITPHSISFVCSLCRSSTASAAAAAASRCFLTIVRARPFEISTQFVVLTRWQTPHIDGGGEGSKVRLSGKQK